MAGRVYCWGYHQHANDQEKTISTDDLEFAPRSSLQHALRPIAIPDLHDVFIESVACAGNHLLAFAPTWVTSISPVNGSVHGGTKVSIFGSGFWASDDLTVRFVPLTEGRLARAALATFDAATGTVCDRSDVGLGVDINIYARRRHFHHKRAQDDKYTVTRDSDTPYHCITVMVLDCVHTAKI